MAGRGSLRRFSSDGRRHGAILCPVKICNGQMAEAAVLMQLDDCWKYPTQLRPLSICTGGCESCVLAADYCSGRLKSFQGPRAGAKLVHLSSQTLQKLNKKVA